MIKKSSLFILFSILSLGVFSQKVGGKVRILEDGTWMSGTLLSIKGNQYFVHFDLRPSSYDKFVKDNEIVFIDGDDRKPIVQVEYRDRERVRRDTVYITQYIRDTIYINRNDNGNWNGNGNGGKGPRGQNFWRVGDRVEVYWGSEWYPARILESQQGKYKISYDGYSNVWDEWVSADKIRKR
ncbi:MAG: hypothetical protein IPP73_04120 [Chitinophagaceae bacterium]|nr:hypothetical protein [Chitinophagaceae bacterium]